MTAWYPLRGHFDRSSCAAPSPKTCLSTGAPPAFLCRVQKFDKRPNPATPRARVCTSMPRCTPDTRALRLRETPHISIGAPIGALQGPLLIRGPYRGPLCAMGQDLPMGPEGDSVGPPRERGRLAARSRLRCQSTRSLGSANTDQKFSRSRRWISLKVS